MLNANLLVNVKLVTCELESNAGFKKKKKLPHVSVHVNSVSVRSVRLQPAVLVFRLERASGSGAERVGVSVGVFARRKSSS